MAVTLTIAGLSGALRLSDDAAEQAEAMRLLAYATEAIEQNSPNAPEATQNEAVIRLAAYLYDQPNAGRGLSYANALRNSGAAMILLPYRVHRAGSTGEAVAAAQAAMGSVGNPVTDLTVVGDVLTVFFADGTSKELPVQAGGGTPGTADLQVERLGTLDGPTLPGKPGMAQYGHSDSLVRSRLDDRRGASVGRLSPCGLGPGGDASRRGSR